MSLMRDAVEFGRFQWSILSEKEDKPAGSALGEKQMSFVLEIVNLGFLWGRGEKMPGIREMIETFWDSHGNYSPEIRCHL